MPVPRQNRPGDYEDLTLLGEDGHYEDLTLLAVLAEDLTRLELAKT